MREPEEKPDVFDRIMSLQLLRPLQPFYHKYKEPLLYLFFGGLTTLLSIFLYWLFAHPLGLAPLVANIISWILCVAFAYVTNRTWVFAYCNPDYGNYCVLLDSSRGLRLGHGGEDVRYRRPSAGLRPRRQRGVRRGAGAAGGSVKSRRWPKGRLRMNSCQRKVLTMKQKVHNVHMRDPVSTQIDFVQREHILGRGVRDRCKCAEFTIKGAL